MNTWTETEDKESGQGCCCVGWRSCHTGRPGSWPSGPLPPWPAYPPNGGWSSVSCSPKGFLQKMASMEKSACIVFVFDTCLYKDLGNTLWITCLNTLWLEDVKWMTLNIESLLFMTCSVTVSFTERSCNLQWFMCLWILMKIYTSLFLHHAAMLNEQYSLRYYVLL